MALISIEQLEDDVQLGLWRIEEAVADFDIPVCHEMLQAFHSDARKLERLATHALLHAMTGDGTLLIRHLPSGKPLLTGWNISVSHTRGYAALMLSRSKRVAVDIERLSRRVERIAPRFLRSDEQASDWKSMLLHWSMKETAYKYYSKQELQYADMRVQGAEPLAPVGTATLENLRQGTLLPIAYRFQPDSVLTYARTPNY